MNLSKELKSKNPLGINGLSVKATRDVNDEALLSPKTDIVSNFNASGHL